MHQTIAFARSGTFAGWPANNGAWIWDGREILVGCSTGLYITQKGHNIIGNVSNLLLRSRNGGETWEIETPASYAGSSLQIQPLLEPLDFHNPGFTMRVIGTGYHGSVEKRGGFYASTNRGKTWEGPYSLTGLNDATPLYGLELTPRTDYIVNWSKDCLLFLSARNPTLWGSDRVFCARTFDGGLHFEFSSWIVGLDDPNRAVMPSTARCGKEKMVSAIRRRSTSSEDCWIDAYQSLDDGLHWKILSRIAQTGSFNGNPPALTTLSDGRLCCVYGNRTRRQLIASISNDEGNTWQELVLRDDFHAPDDEPDFGYPRLVQRHDGELVAVYYWATLEVPQQHIAVTIWNPG